MELVERQPAVPDSLFAQQLVPQGLPGAWLLSYRNTSIGQGLFDVFRQRRFQLLTQGRADGFRLHGDRFLLGREQHGPVPSGGQQDEEARICPAGQA
jgi:hypothetical protein